MRSGALSFPSETSEGGKREEETYLLEKGKGWQKLIHRTDRQTNWISLFRGVAGGVKSFR